MNEAPFVAAHRLAQILAVLAVFAVGVGLGVGIIVRRRLPTVKAPEPSKMRTVWAGRPLVDDGGCCDEDDSP